MIPHKVTLENFLSFGPRTEIAFTADEPLWVLGGPNGVGKSAVFDAITFCLFGVHRGGQQGHENLVRHGAAGFSVTVEFAAGAAEYRVTRSRSGSRSTQAVEERGPGETAWRRVPNVNSVPEVKKWAEETLGLGFEAFKASVLLRQGEADAIITAGGADRLKILKKIIGVERYEKLSEGVHAASRGKKARFEDAAGQLANEPDVPPADFAAATVTLTTEAQKRERARAAEADALARVERAKQWAGLDAKRLELDRLLAEADARRAAATDIRAGATRLAELGGVVGTLRQLVELRDASAAADATLAELRMAHAAHADTVKNAGESATAAAERAEAARGQFEEASTAARVAEQALKDARRKLETAELVAAVVAQLSALPANLDAKLLAAGEVVRHTEAQAGDATDARAAAAALLRQREKEFADFGTVEVGATCSRCGQAVDAEHAEKERGRLTADVARLKAEVKTATATAAEFADRLKAAKDAATNLQRAAGERDTLTAKKLTLTRHGEPDVPGDVRVTIDRLDREHNQHAAAATAAKAARDGDLAAAKRHDADRQAAEKSAAAAAKKLTDAEATRAAATARRTALAGTLRGDWPARWEALAAADVAGFADEERRLTAAGVAARFAELQADDTRRAEWDRQRAAVADDLAAVPADSRVTAATAERDAEAAKGEAAARAAAHDAARKRCDDLTARMARRAALQETVKGAEDEARIHAKLDLHLGKAGLQRELVRDAEAKIVRFANETVRHLSDGDLSIELDQSDDGGDEAFALRVKRADSPTPIAVAFLSGSQKFRVAVAVALAIGQYASTQARSLECVIIDEGFGSLDKDGLRATADELNRLKQHLKRIILVSHQDEFTDHFPVVIQLAKGEHGTTATAVRR